MHKTITIRFEVDESRLGRDVDSNLTQKVKDLCVEGLGTLLDDWKLNSEEDIQLVDAMISER